MDVRGVEANEVWSYVLRILEQPDVLPELTITFTLHTPEGDIVPNVVKFLQEDRDYANSFAAKFRLIAEFQAGTIINTINKHKDKLKMSIVIDDHYFPIRYDNLRAVPIIEGDVQAESGDPGSINTEELDRYNSGEISFELGTQQHEQMRYINFQSFPLRTNLLTAIKSLYSPDRCSQWGSPPNSALPTAQQVADGTYTGEIGVDVVPPSNENVYDVIYIPKEVTYSKLIPYLQEAYGLWVEGAARFHHRGMWYVYPLFNKTRYDNEKKTLTIVNIPERKLPELGRNYEVKDGNVFILSNGKVSVEDNTWTRTLAEGDGVRYINANKVQDDYAVRTGGKLKFNKADNVITRSINPRDDGLNDYMSDNRVARANHYVANSKLAHKRGKIITLVWTNGNPDLLYPGQPLAFLYAEGDVVRQLKGTLLNNTPKYTKDQPNNRKDNIYTRDVVLSMWVGEPD